MTNVYTYTHTHTQTRSVNDIRLGYAAVCAVYCIKDKNRMGLIHFSLVIFIIIVNAAIQVLIHWNQQSNKNETSEYDQRQQSVLWW